MIIKIFLNNNLRKIDYYWIEKNGSSNVKILPDDATSIIFNIENRINIFDPDGK